VEGLFRVTEKAGLRLQLADVSPAALCNAFRYNYGDLEDCTMLLDIGAKTSNLLFFEKGKVYSRSINLGANSITQDFANESKLPFAEADAKKIAEGFVSLGGAYEEPENPHQAAISKIARQFMTRLHIQVNQTMQFYRGQQGGSAPQRLFLSGGASIMPYTAQFFAEKLNVPVEYFNPFRNVQIDPNINLEELARVAHSMGEVVGLGLRNLAHCPVELNLMPESTLNWVNFNQKKPYFIATVFSLVAVVFATGFIYDRLANVYTDELEKLKTDIAPLLTKENAFKKAYGDMQKAKQDAGQYATWLEDRYYWGDVLSELHHTMQVVEGETGTSLHTPTGVWIEKLVSAPPSPEELAAAGGMTMGAPEGAPPMLDPRFMDPSIRRGRGGMNRDAAAGVAPNPDPSQPPPPDGATPPAPVPPRSPKTSGSSTNEISMVTILCRAVDVTSAGGVASANTDIAYAVERALKESPLFDKDETHLSGTINPTDPNGTFTFGVDVKLKRPLKL
jgi:hypothetical protein